jgi:anthranilate synthase component 1
MRAAAGEPSAFLLESVEGGESVARYSFLGWGPRLILRARGTRITEEAGGRRREFEGNVFEALRERLGGARPARVEGLPRLTSGAVGYIGYDAVRLLERIPDGKPDHLGCPDVVFGFHDRIAAFDHVRQRIVLMSALRAEGPAEARRRYRQAEEALDAMEAALARPGRRAGRAAASRGRRRRPARPASNVTRRDFEEKVRAARGHVRAGDVFQVVLSQRFEAPLRRAPFEVYRALRRINPSPYLYFLSDGPVALAGSSPEMLVRVEDGRIETRPIAGTRPRGRNEEEDRRLEADLLGDAKERAEHLMLVDLARNDVGRVAERGSVEVGGLMSVERYSHVMHLVTRVRGRLRPGLDAVDALTACFPAGTVSGAPKVRAMEIIEELEPARRGPYAGAVAYADASGNLDSCITIRTLVSVGGRAYVQAGAGIVADSTPAREYDETCRKAEALLAALREGGGG